MNSTLKTGAAVWGVYPNRNHDGPDGKRRDDGGFARSPYCAASFNSRPSWLYVRVPLPGVCNFAALDPVQQARGIRGLPGATKQDSAMWNEFHSNLSVLGTESEELLHDLFTKDETKEVDFLARDKVRLVAPSGPTEMQATVKVRRGQQFFRQSVLTAYGVRCCISSINVPRLLVASHIKPWGKFPADRLNPRNGLCLSALHDAAFDAGLITLDDKLNVLLSKRLRGFFPQRALEQNFVPFEGQPIRLPEKLAEPDGGFLRYHRDEIFQSCPQRRRRGIFVATQPEQYPKPRQVSPSE